MFSSLLHANAKAWRKWPTGIRMLWYPLKDRRRVAAFSPERAGSVARRVLRVELDVTAGEHGLTAAGLFIINPPWRLADELKRLLGWLAPVLAQAPSFACRLDWACGEK